MNPNVEQRFWSKVNRLAASECWEWQAHRFHFGHGTFWLEGKMRIASRVAWELANGPIADGLQVLHHCDNPPCVNPSHLYLGTHADNMRDRDERNRLPRGEKRPGAKLTPPDVREIRRRVASGELRVDVARLFGVSHTQVGLIVRRKKWAHVA